MTEPICENGHPMKSGEARCPECGGRLKMQWMSGKAAPAPTPGAPAQVAVTSTPWFKNAWLIAGGVGVVALLAGIGIGVAAQQAPEDSPQYVALDGKYEEALEKTKRVDEVDAREKELDARESALDAQASDLESTEADLTAREKAVGIKEQEIIDNTISGDGIYRVGVDIKAGRYKTAGNSTCYYAVLSSTSTNDILENGNPRGAAYVTVRNGQYLQLALCEDWVLQ